MLVSFDVDASNWKTKLDLYRDLLPAIGAPKWHGWSVDALIDSMVWGGRKRTSASLHGARLRNGKIAEGGARPCRTRKAPPHGSLRLFS